MALRLTGGLEYTNATVEFVTHCCDFHGCGNYGFYRGCLELFKAGESWKITGKHKKWLPGPHMHREMLLLTWLDCRAFISVPQTMRAAWRSTS